MTMRLLCALLTCASLLEACPRPALVADRAIEDPDVDADGIPTDVDKCPNDPEDRDGFEDTDGCPDPDNDGDGVMDGDDRCPLEPELATNGVTPDGDGCPDHPPVIVIEPEPPPVYVPVIPFAKGSATLGKRERVELDAFAVFVLGRADLVGHVIEVRGHAEDGGSRAADLKLSERRASVVRGYLLSKGVPPGQLLIRGFGRDHPTAPPGDSRNRRVDFGIAN